MLKVMIIALILVFCTHIQAIACEKELIEKITILGTDWQAIATANSCGLWTSGGSEEIEVFNELTGKSVIIGEGDSIWETHLRSMTPGELTISVPNKSDIVQTFEVPDQLRVKFVFFPKDDAGYRDSYRRWLRDPRDASNINWYCSHVFLEYPSLERAFINKFNSEHFLGQADTYCK